MSEKIEQRKDYCEPGNEPITTDDLLLQIGEKEVDLLRKKKAINKLTNQLNVLLKVNEELSNKLTEYKDMETNPNP